MTNQVTNNDIDEVSKKEFETYEMIRKSGEYNMFTDGYEVMLKMKLNPRHKSDCRKYLSIINNYSYFADKYNCN